jgi:DNA-binding PadR family transcriptional regulator
MMGFGRPWMRESRLLRRGDIRVLVLEVLSKQPMHGYEVVKEISGIFGGLYSPSPGIVYPTLQWLEDEGYIGITEKGGKKTYKLTAPGTKFYQENKAELERLLKGWKQAREGGRLELMEAGMKLRRTMGSVSRDLDKEKAKKAAAILEDARKKIEKLALE